jgi:hypothetical protein
MRNWELGIENWSDSIQNPTMDLHDVAQDRFGKSRAEELRSEVDTLAEDIRRIRSVPVEQDDEP